MGIEFDRKVWNCVKEICHESRLMTREYMIYSDNEVLYNIMIIILD